MNQLAHESRGFGTRITDVDGRTVELHGKVKIGQVVTWLGRKVGSGVNDAQFDVGGQYEVCYIYDNGDVELQGEEPGITTRANDSEYGK